MTDNQFNKLQHNDRNILISFCQWTVQNQTNFQMFLSPIPRITLNYFLMAPYCK